MLEIIAAYIEHHRLLPECGEVIVGVSGGADSLCLLHLLLQLCGPDKRYPDVRLHVAHLDHQLRGKASEQEAAIVAQLARLWELPCTLGVIDVPALARKEQRSLEDAARTARYRFLREVAQGQPIAVAHHMDDQVETLILHWMRGGGLASMVGLLPRQQDIIRPLLAITHADTLAYCQQLHLTPVEDASNTDPRFLRNRIRHELVPLLESMNPGIRATLLRNAEVMHIDVQWIEAQVDTCWPTVVTHEQYGRIRLQRRALLAQPLSLQRHLLRRVTARLSAGQSPLELRHYKLIEQLLHRENQGEELTLHLPQQLCLVRAGDSIVFEYRKDSVTYNEPATEKREVFLPIPGCVALPGTPWTAVAEIVPDEIRQKVREALQCKNWKEVWHILDATGYIVYISGDNIENMLRIRTRRPGDRIRPLGMAHEKKIQDILVDKHIVRAEREQIPLFFSASHCVWLAGICPDDRVRLTTETQKIVRLSIIQT